MTYKGQKWTLVKQIQEMVCRFDFRQLGRTKDAHKLRRTGG